MSFWKTALICTLATAAAAGAQAAGPMTTRTINDDFGFDQPVKAWTVSVPAGWALRGAVQWYGAASCPFERNKVHFMMAAPDGSQRIEFIPGGAWGWTSTMDFNPQSAREGAAGCRAMPVRDAMTFMRQYIPAIRPGAAVGQLRARTDLVAEAAGFVAQTQSQLPQGQRARLEIVDAPISYKSGGKTVYETLRSFIMFTDQPAVDMYGGMNGYVTIGIDLGTYAAAGVGAPPDLSLMKAVSDSAKMTPQYEQRMQQFYANIVQNMAAANARRHYEFQNYVSSLRNTSSTIAKNNSDILDIQMEGYKKRSGMIDAGQAKTVDMIGEQTQWVNTAGERISLPQQYGRVYELQNGAYVGTNDRLFNPVEATGQFGEELQQYDYSQ